MAKNLPSGRAKNAISKGGRLAEIYRKKTPEEKSKLAGVMSAIKKHGPGAAMMLGTGPTGMVRGGIGLTGMAVKAGAKVIARAGAKKVVKKIAKKAFPTERQRILEARKTISEIAKNRPEIFKQYSGAGYKVGRTKGGNPKFEKMEEIVKSRVALKKASPKALAPFRKVAAAKPLTESQKLAMEIKKKSAAYAAKYGKK